MTRTVLLFLLAWSGVAMAEEADPAADRTIVETIMRLEGFDISSSEKAQGAVARFLKANWGTDEYIQLIERFELRGHEKGLLKLALEKPTETIGTQAVQLLLKQGKDDLLLDAARGDDTEKAKAAITVIGSSRFKHLAAAIPELVRDTKRPTEVRASAIQTMGKLFPKELLQLAQANSLEAELQSKAVEALLTSNLESVRTTALLLRNGGRHAEVALPGVAELAKKRGDAGKGKTTFSLLCGACHMPSPLNIDFGPNLSEIGDKLARQEMYTAIIDPSAGISFGYEKTTITLNDQSSRIGFVASETDEALTLKMAGGIQQEFARSDIGKVQKDNESLMPKGLEKILSLEDLVNLVEYLITLKKAP